MPSLSTWTEWSATFIARPATAAAGTPIQPRSRSAPACAWRPLNDGEAEFRSVSDDQSIVTGYAIDLPGTNWLPPEHWLAWRLMRRIERLRTACAGLKLGPDGKLIVIYDEEANRLAAFSASLQQEIGGSEIELHRAIRQAVRDELAECAGAIPGFAPELPDQFTVNGAGNFEVGGPEGDNGLSGKKLVVDAYGPRVPIGGGALSGKDFFKVDRAGAILARRIAKAIVLTGAARECSATLAVFPGDTAFRLVSIAGDQGRSLDVSRWSSLFDFSLASCGEAYAGVPDLINLARYGHFTGAHPWEKLRF